MRFWAVVGEIKCSSSFVVFLRMSSPLRCLPFRKIAVVVCGGPFQETSGQSDAVDGCVHVIDMMIALCPFLAKGMALCRNLGLQPHPLSNRS